MTDFSATTRNSAIWSGDSRKVAQGKANEVILTKQGKMPIPDLSDIEAVQMGHVMEPVIGRLAQAKLGVELTKIEDSLTHKKHDWFKSHFDFAGRKMERLFLLKLRTTTQVLVLSLMLVASHPLRMLHNWYMKLLCSVSIWFISPYCSEVKSFSSYHLLSQRNKRMTLSNRWQSSGDMPKRVQPFPPKT